MPNLKFVPLAIFELIGFNAQKFMGSRNTGHLFSPSFGIQGLEAIETCRLNYELLLWIRRWLQRSVSSLALKMHYVGANLGQNWVKIGYTLVGF